MIICPKCPNYLIDKRFYKKNNEFYCYYHKIKCLQTSSQTNLQINKKIQNSKINQCIKCKNYDDYKEHSEKYCKHFQIAFYPENLNPLNNCKKFKSKKPKKKTINDFFKK